MGRTHAKAWAALGFGEQIAYVCTPHPGPPLDHAPRARMVSELSTVLADPAVNILSVCSPTPSHAAIAVAALAAGKHVLLEKPIAGSLEDARAIEAAAEASTGILMVAHVVRFFEGYRLLREDVTAGLLGTPLSVRARRLIDKPDPSSWWHDESRSGGVLLDVAIHDFDQLNLFLGEPVAVTSRGAGRLGPFETTVEYAAGGIGQVLSYADTPSGVPFTSSIELLGTRGGAEYRLAGAKSSYRISAADAPATRAIAADAPYTRQIEYFLDCIRTGSQPDFCPTASAVQALAVSLAARRSSASGSRVLLPTAG